MDPLKKIITAIIDVGEIIRHLNKEVHQALSDDEEKTALMYRAIIHLILFCGLRVGEVADLSRKDIEINERTGTTRGRRLQRSSWTIRKRGRRYRRGWNTTSV